LHQIPVGNQAAALALAQTTATQEIVMLRGALLWLIGLPLPIILILWLLGYLH